MLNASVSIHLKQHVVAGGAGKVTRDVTRRVPKQKGLISAELQKLSHYVGIQQGAFDADFCARGKCRIAIFGNDPRYLPGQTSQLQVMQRIHKQSGRARKLRLRRLADLIERIPLKRKKGKV